jgi:hypothetical protein
MGMDTVRNTYVGLYGFGQVNLLPGPVEVFQVELKFRR